MIVLRASSANVPQSHVESSLVTDQRWWISKIGTQRGSFLKSCSWFREYGKKASNPTQKGAAAILSHQISLPDGTCMILAVSAWQLTACWRTQAALNDLNHLEQGISVFAAVCIPCLKRETAWHLEMLSLTSWLWKPGSSFETQHCLILSHGARSTSSEDWMAATFRGPFKVHSRFVRAISLGSSPWFQLLRRQA